MFPASFQSFFMASAGAGAALIGLLFVAISISPDRIFQTGRPEQTAVATSAFTALVNAFFISLGALIPGIPVGWVVVVLALLGVSNSLNLGIRLLRSSGATSWATLLRRAVLVLISLIIYGDEVYVALPLISGPHSASNDAGAVSVIAVLMMCVYGLGLTRAWELLGAPRYTILSWLSPMHDLNRDAEVEEQGAAVQAVEATTPANTARQAKRPGER
jgi:hypothetical protein